MAPSLVFYFYNIEKMKNDFVQFGGRHLELSFFQNRLSAQTESLHQKAVYYMGQYVR